jgi:hypothetical protein
MLWAFDIKPAKDPHGKDIDVDMYVRLLVLLGWLLTDCEPSFAYTDGFNSVPLPFQCSIVPRSPAHARVVEQEFQKAMVELKAYGSVSNSIS